MEKKTYFHLITGQMKLLKITATEPIKHTHRCNEFSMETNLCLRCHMLLWLLTLNEIVNELDGWGAEVKRLNKSRGDSPRWGRVDNLHCISLHIHTDNWTSGRSRSRWVPAVMRKSAAPGSPRFYGDGGGNGSSWACDLCDGKHLRLIWDWLSRDGNMRKKVNTGLFDPIWQ